MQIVQHQAVPNDPQFTAGNQWALNGTWGINAPAAWDTTTGLTRAAGKDFASPRLRRIAFVVAGAVFLAIAGRLLTVSARTAPRVM